MKRSQFLGSAALATMGSFVGCRSKRTNQEKDSVGPEDKNRTIKKIGGVTLEQLRERYRTALFGQFLPNMDRYVIDHKYGGFMTTVDIRTGKQLSTDKRAWYEGRGMWVYSFLYNNFKEDPHYLEVARKSKDFILKHQPSDDSFWVGTFSREGKPLSGPGDIYGNLFIAEGLAEYAKASGEGQYFERAKEITLRALARYDQPDYDYPISYGPKDAPRIQGPRVLGHWMVFLDTATHLLRQESDPKIKKLSDRCIDAIMNYHLNSDYNILNSGLNHDLSLPHNEWAEFSEIGHAIETLWMMMYEAVRRKDEELFHKAQKLFKRHVRVAYDGVYGGHFTKLKNVDNYTWRVRKALWLQEEVLIGTLFQIEHTGDMWAQQCFTEAEAYVQEKFDLPGLKFWPAYSNRTVGDYQTNRAEHYHHPRHFMLNILALNRMIKRGGKVSGVFG